MPSTVKSVNGIALEDGSFELRSNIQLNRKSNRNSDAVLDIIVYETSANGEKKETHPVNGRRIYVSDFEGKLSEPMCFDVGFAANSHCTYSVCYQWKGSTDISVTKTDFVKHGTPMEINREFVLQTKSGVCRISELPDGFLSGDRLTCVNGDLSASVPSSVLFELLKNYDSVDIFIGNSGDVARRMLNNLAAPIKSVKDISKYISFSVSGSSKNGKTEIKRLKNKVKISVKSGSVKPVAAAKVYVISPDGGLNDSNALTENGILLRLISVFCLLFGKRRQIPSCGHRLSSCFLFLLPFC